MRFSPRLLRYLRRFLLGLAVVATILAVAVTFENWRGRRAWRLYVEEQAARGVDVTTLPQPSSLPAASNFMRSPVFDRLFWQSGTASQQEFTARHGLPNRRQGPSGAAWREGRRLELDECIYALTTGPKPRPTQPPAEPTREMAEQLLALQQPVEALLEELRTTARERAESQLARPKPMDPRDPFAATPSPFFYIRHIVTAQVWHASASLATGREEIALYDALAGLKFLRGMEEAPDALLVDTMIGSAGTGLVMQAVWEGLQGRKWNEPQLALLGAELARADLLASLQRSLHTDRVAGNLSIDQLGWGDSPAKRVIKDSRSKELAWLPYLPAGWIQQNKLQSNRWVDGVLSMLAARGTVGFAERMRRLGEQPKDAGNLRAPYTLVSAPMASMHGKVVPAIVYQQTTLRLAATACALERHRLAHGRHPDRLAELVPAFLDKVPLDLMDDQPLRYERDDATGRFALYSIGYDGKDDGGRTMSKNRGDVQRAIDPGDWVWPQPAAERKQPVSRDK